MKVFRYFGLLILLCVSHLIVDLPCKAEAHLGNNHVKQWRKEPVPSNGWEKNVLKEDLNRKHIAHETSRDHGSTVKKQDESSLINSEQKQRSFSKENSIHTKPDLRYHMVGKPGGNSTNSAQERANDVRSKTIGSKSAHSKTSNITTTKAQGKSNYLHSKKNTNKKMVVKKYSLMQSMNPLQSESEYSPIATAGQESIAGFDPQVHAEQTGESRGQELSPEEQQQQPTIGDSNSLSQYGASQDGAAYQQENSQSSLASFASSNNEDAGQRQGGQPSSLEQAIQLQQAGYTQQAHEQGQDEESIRPDSQGGELAGQGSQMFDSGQMQYQGEQASQGQEQGAQEQSDQQQSAGQPGFEQAGFQQEQPKELDQQQSQGIDQQQQDQTQEYQQQQQQQQQPSEEPQESEGISSESQSLTTSSNSYGGLFGSEGQQTAGEQQGQGTLSYANEQSNEGGDKTAAPSGVQYASSIEEALKEPSLSPQESQESQESNSEGRQGQGSLGASDGDKVVNIGPGSDSKDGSNNGFIGAGTISAPSGYQTSTVDDNGNPIQTGSENEVNGYASMNDQAANDEANGFDENQQSPSSSSSQSQTSFNFGQKQFQKPSAGPKVPPLADDVYKIISIANKHGPFADHVSVSDEESQPNDCKDECHYNAKCINRECICKTGYTGDGLDCRPDTCLPGCKLHGKCIKGFCVCDHHHYFNGYECAPYKITHRNCPLQCATSCHARCPSNCCKHHPVLKIHYNDGNPQHITTPPNTSPSKSKDGPRPTEVVLKPMVKVGEAITNFAPDFQQRPGDSDAANLEAITLKDPAGGFAVSQTEAKPVLGEEECPDKCKTECRDNCPVRCCLGKCPVRCMKNCEPSCPKSCCYLPGAKNPFPMMDSKVQEYFMKTMAEKFCPSACKTKCDSKCPPICCEHNSSSVALADANFQNVKSESKNSADFFKNAMSWFGMMNFLNMMYSMYGNLYNPKHMKFPLKVHDHKVNTFHLPKPKNHINFKEVGVAEKPNDPIAKCPEYCNKTCLPLCPPKCCHGNPKEPTLNKVGTPIQCLPSCSWFCSNSCPAHCCSKNKRPLELEHHTTEPIKVAKSSPITPPQRSLVKPPAACTPSCPAYCYPNCLETCCRRGNVSSVKPTAAQDQTKQPYNNTLSKQPTTTSWNCPTICEKNCAPSCPVRCCPRSLSSPTSPRLLATSQAQTTAPLCPGGCVSECFPACTISCCRADLNKHASDVNNQTENSIRRQNQPATKAIPFSSISPIALCHPGCSQSCYPNCDETCCRASLEHPSGLARSTKVDGASPITIKVPCPIECRPFNCLYYCHHDCCLQGKETTNLKKIRYQAPSLLDKGKYLNGMKKKKTLTSRPRFMHVPSDRRSGVRIGTDGQ